MDTRPLELAVARVMGYTAIPAPLHDGTPRWRLLAPSGKQYPICLTKDRAWQSVPHFARSESAFLPLVYDYFRLRPFVHTVSPMVSPTNAVIWLHWWLDETCTFVAPLSSDVSEEHCGVFSVSAPTPGQCLCEGILVLEAIYDRIPADEVASLCGNRAAERAGQIAKWRKAVAEWIRKHGR